MTGPGRHLSSPMTDALIVDCGARPTAVWMDSACRKATLKHSASQSLRAQQCNGVPAGGCLCVGGFGVNCGVAAASGWRLRRDTLGLRSG